MILYTKTFPLGKDVSFSHYTKALGEKSFPNYVLLIEKAPATENYRAEIVFTGPSIWPSDWNSSFFEGILFKECTIQYLKGAREFTLQASIGTKNLLLASLYIILGLLILLPALFMTFTKSIPVGGLLVATAMALLISAPATLTYIREKKLLERIGSLALELSNK